MSQANRYVNRVQTANEQLGFMHPEYNDSSTDRNDRRKKEDEKETQRLSEFVSNPKPIDYIVFIACHGMTVDDFSSKARYKAMFPFETVLGSHLGMPVFRYDNHAIYNWMCDTHIPQIIEHMKLGNTYTGEAIFQEGGLFDSIFTYGSPKKIRFTGETTADLNLFIPGPFDQSSSTLERNPDGIYVFNLDPTSADTHRCKDIAPEILTSVFDDPTQGGKTYIHRTDGEYAVDRRVQTVKLSTLFYVLSQYFKKPEYNDKRIVIMLGSCRSVPDSFYRALQSTSGSSDSEGGRNTRRSRRIKKTRRRGAMSRRNVRNRTSYATNKK